MMEKVPFLTILWLLPLLGILGIYTVEIKSNLAQKSIRLIAFVTTLVCLAYVIYLYQIFDPSVEKFQFVEKRSWLPFLYLRYYLGIDGLSLVFIMLTAFVFPIAIMSSWNTINYRYRQFYALLLISESCLFATFMSLDMIMFFIFFEGILIPMFFLISIWGGENKVYASFKLILYTLSGSILMAVAIIAMSTQMDSSSLKLAMNFNFPIKMQYILWFAFFLSFAIKTPIIPFHTWLPDAHVQAPAAGSIILAGILLKLGGYGFLRFSLSIFSDATIIFAPFMRTLGIIAIIYASLVALAQKDIKKLIAYASIAHMGYVILGIFTLTADGINGAIFQMLSHGIISSALFMSVGFLYHQTHTRDIKAYSGLSSITPHFSFLFFIFTLGNLALPLTSGFVGEFMVLLSTYSISPYLTFLGGTGIIFSATYSLYLYYKIFLGKVHGTEHSTIKDVEGIEKISMSIIATLIILLGIYPKKTISIFENFSKEIESIYKESQPS